MNTDSLNRKYFGFLEKDYGFKYSKSIFYNQDAEFSIFVYGDHLPILSLVGISIWFKVEPKCTRISFQWVAKYFGFRLSLDFEQMPNSLAKNYSKLSSALQECMPKILSSREEWLLPSMTSYFDWEEKNTFHNNIILMLSKPDVLEMYDYIKSKDLSWNPS
jgi:hypothetical protein